MSGRTASSKRTTASFSHVDRMKFGTYAHLAMWDSAFTEVSETPYGLPVDGRRGSGCREQRLQTTPISPDTHRYFVAGRRATRPGAIFPLTAMMDLPVHQYTYAPAPISSYANACACRARSYCSTMIPKGILGFHAMAYSNRQLLTPISVLMRLSSASVPTLQEFFSSGVYGPTSRTSC